MEMVTDILAIVGWASAGALLPGMLFIFRSHKDDEQFDGVIVTCALTFGLIAASLVLG